MQSSSYQKEQNGSLTKAEEQVYQGILMNALLSSE